MDTLLVFVLASVVMGASALRREAAAMLQDTPDVVVQGLRMGRHEMSRAADLERLRGLRGTQPAQGRLWGYLYDTASGANYTLQVPPTGSEPALTPGQAVVGEGVARLRRLAAGSPLFLVSPSGVFLNLRVQMCIRDRAHLICIKRRLFQRTNNTLDGVYPRFSVHGRNACARVGSAVVAGAPELADPRAGRCTGRLVAGLHTARQAAFACAGRVRRRLRA